MSGKYGTSNAGAESVGVSDCNKYYLLKSKTDSLSVISELLKHMSSEGFDDVGLRYVWEDLGLVGIRPMGKKTIKWKAQEHQRR
ncbi:hypothetical protein Tco_0514703 [Tanacetum coccineum]